MMIRHRTEIQRQVKVAPRLFNLFWSNGDEEYDALIWTIDWVVSSKSELSSNIYYRNIISTYTFLNNYQFVNKAMSCYYILQ